MPDAPKVSIIVNCFNGERYLREAIDSIYAQTYQNWEIVFWDNLSTDNSAKIATTYDKRLKYFRGEKLVKLYSARRLAIKKAEGEYLAFLDVDDWWEPEKLTTQMDAMLHNNASLVYSAYFFHNAIKNRKKIIRATRIKNRESAFNELSRHSAGLLTLLIKKTSYDEIGGFNENYNLIGDHDLVLKLSNRHTVFGIQQPLAHYRWHGDNVSIKDVASRVGELKAMLHEYQVANTYPETGLRNIKDGLLYFQIIEAINKKERILALNYLPNIHSKSLLIKALIRIILPKNVIDILSA